MVKVLVLDDYRLGRRLLADELTDEGYEVVENEAVGAALNLIQAERPDLLVMEIRAPYGDFLPLVYDIKKHHEDLPVIIWTCLAESKNDPRVRAADYFVLKSSSLTEIKKSLRRAVKNLTRLHGGILEGAPCPCQFQGFL
ncbi:MAG: response regulator [Pseudomonadota bacterium]